MRTLSLATVLPSLLNIDTIATSEDRVCGKWSTMYLSQHKKNSTCERIAKISVLIYIILYNGFAKYSVFNTHNWDQQMHTMCNFHDLTSPVIYQKENSIMFYLFYFPMIWSKARWQKNPLKLIYHTIQCHRPRKTKLRSIFWYPMIAFV